MIAARKQKETSLQEQAAFVKFFNEHPELGEPESADCTHNANEIANYVVDQWKVEINSESMATAFRALSEAGRLKLKSPAQLRWEQASKHLSSQTLEALDHGIQCHLVTEGDEGFENRINLLGYLQGREISTATILRAAEYSGGRGIRIYWQARPSQSKEHRGHIPASQNDFRFAPKEDSNHTPLSRHSHSSNPAFNGENDRKKMRRMNQPPDDPMAAHTWVWMQQAKALVGSNHSETKRVQHAVSQAKPGYAAYEAGRQELRRIEIEKARAR